MGDQFLSCHRDGYGNDGTVMSKYAFVDHAHLKPKGQTAKATKPTEPAKAARSVKFAREDQVCDGTWSETRLHSKPSKSSQLEGDATRNAAFSAGMCDAELPIKNSTRDKEWLAELGIY